jgi:hypothetical protein
LAGDRPAAGSNSRRPHPAAADSLAEEGSLAEAGSHPVAAGILLAAAGSPGGRRGRRTAAGPAGTGLGGTATARRMAERHRLPGTAVAGDSSRVGPEALVLPADHRRAEGLPRLDRGAAGDRERAGLGPLVLRAGLKQEDRFQLVHSKAFATETRAERCSPGAVKVPPQWDMEKWLRPADTMPSSRAAGMLHLVHMAGVPRPGPGSLWPAPAGQRLAGHLESETQEGGFRSQTALERLVRREAPPQRCCTVAAADRRHTAAPEGRSGRTRELAIAQEGFRAADRLVGLQEGGLGRSGTSRWTRWCTH